MDNVIDILKKVGAIITDDHFVYTSGKHGSVYINKDALYPHTEETSQVGMLFAKKAKDLDIDVVVGPMIGGIILSQWTAYHLSSLKSKEVLSVYTEKDEKSNQVFGRRGYDKVVKGKNVLVVEDLTTTGGSVAKVVETVKAAGGSVVSTIVMVNRDPKKINGDLIGSAFMALGELPAEAWDENKCPLCKKGVPINTIVGHGKKYLAAKGNTN